MTASVKLELFHEIAHPGSAQVRKHVVDSGWLPLLRFRNVAYDEVAADLKLHGGGAVLPALWDGVSLFEGVEAVLARLSRATDKSSLAP